MREVSTRACESLLASLEVERISPSDWLHDLPIDLHTLGDAGEWIDWDLFAELLERFEELAEGIDPVMRVGTRLLQDPTMVANRALVSAFRNLEQLYQIGGRLRTAAYYTHLRRSCETLEDGRFRIVTEIPRSYRGCEAFFRLNAGIARATPRLLGRRDALVEAEITPHRGFFLVTPPRASVTSLLTRRGRRAGTDRSLALLALKEEELRARRGADMAAHGSAGSDARAALDAVGLPLLVVDVWGDDDLRIFGINRLMELQTDLRDLEVAGRRPSEAFAAAGVAPWVDLLWRCIEQRAVVETPLEDGGERRRIRLVPVLGGGGDVVRVYLSSLRDVASPSPSTSPEAAAC